MPMCMPGTQTYREEAPAYTADKTFINQDNIADRLSILSLPLSKHIVQCSL